MHEQLKATRFAEWQILTDSIGVWKHAFFDRKEHHYQFDHQDRQRPIDDVDCEPDIVPFDDLEEPSKELE